MGGDKKKRTVRRRVRKARAPATVEAGGGGADQELLDHLNKLLGTKPELRRYGRRSAGVSVAIGKDYPEPGLTTFVTIGASRQPVSVYRGRDVGRELTMTLAKPDPEMIETLANAVLEDLRRRSTENRRPCIEYNGVSAPGYAPHLFFTDQLSLTPKLRGQIRFESTIIEFLAAIPIGDSELRIYDRDVLGLIKRLRHGRIEKYPRQ
jgi:hypothetical protein